MKNKFCQNGLVSLKMENMSELSWEAEGLLIRMANNPQCDYTTPEEIHSLFPADSITTYEKALNELLQKNFVIQVSQKYAVNKIKMIQTMCYLGESDDMEKNSQQNYDDKKHEIDRTRTREPRKEQMN